MDTKTRVSVFQNPSRDVRTLGNTEAQSPRSRQPEIYCSLPLCGSVSLCFKIRPGILESATSSCVRAEATNLVPPRIIGLEMILCLVNWSPTLLPRQSAN